MSANAIATASASAKIILVGEHAVVYGHPAIAVPVSAMRASAVVTRNPPGVRGLHITSADLTDHAPVVVTADVLDNALTLPARLTLDYLHTAPPDMTITIHSDIPIASGLGSGAAVSTAIARALSAALDQPLSVDALNTIVYEVEKVHHGTPSGIDNTVIAYERPVYFVRDHPIETITIGAPLMLVIADTGRGALTKVAVGAVRELVNTHPARTTQVLDKIGALVREARDAIERGDAARLGQWMTYNHVLLHELTVSSLELDTLGSLALNAGALGAKLSGGGRGGNMIALVTPETRQRVEDVLLAAGATRVLSTTLAETQP